jgi:hypothetical protein
MSRYEQTFIYVLRIFSCVYVCMFINRNKHELIPPCLKIKVNMFMGEKNDAHISLFTVKRDCNSRELSVKKPVVLRLKRQFHSAVGASADIRFAHSIIVDSIKYSSLAHLHI